jgi:enoyl-CoA hydratase
MGLASVAMGSPPTLPFLETKSAFDPLPEACPMSDLSSRSTAGSDLVLAEVSEGVATVTVNRPDKLNALNREVLDALDQAFSELEARGDVGAVIVTGSGERAFVAGADIGALATMTPLSAEAVSRHGQRVFARIERFPRPVLAAVNGFALGGGLELALACHIRIASTSARFGLPEVGLGIIPGYGGTVRLSRLVGLGRAVEMTLLGAPIPAQEALAMGLVTRVVEGDTLLATAREMAATLLTRGPLALQMALEAVYHAQDVSAEEALRLESKLFGLLAASTDMAEGMKAFLEKRKPTFRGE